MAKIKRLNLRDGDKIKKRLTDDLEDGNFEDSNNTLGPYIPWDGPGEGDSDDPENWVDDADDIKKIDEFGDGDLEGDFDDDDKVKPFVVPKSDVDLEKPIDDENIDDIKTIDEFGEEDWEEQEESSEYTFLKNLQEFVNTKAHAKKNTRKFLRMAFDLVRQGEISQETLDDYIKMEGIKPEIVEEIRMKKKRKHIRLPVVDDDGIVEIQGDIDDDDDYGSFRDPCGGSSGGRSGC